MLLMDFHGGDSITLSGRINQSILGWEIRCEMQDNSGTSIRKATANVPGGGEQQILLVDPSAGRFKIFFQPVETIQMRGDVNVQIKVRDNNDQETTIYNEFLNISASTGITWEELANFTHIVFPVDNLILNSADADVIEGLGVSSLIATRQLNINLINVEDINLDYSILPDPTTVNFNIQEPIIIHNSAIATPEATNMAADVLTPVVTPVVLIEIIIEPNLITDINNVIVTTGSTYIDDMISISLDAHETMILQGVGVSINGYRIDLRIEPLSSYEGVPYGAILYPSIASSDINTLDVTVITV